MNNADRPSTTDVRSTHRHSCQVKVNLDAIHNNIHLGGRHKLQRRGTPSKVRSPVVNLDPGNDCIVGGGLSWWNGKISEENFRHCDFPSLYTYLGVLDSLLNQILQVIGDGPLRHSRDASEGKLGHISFLIA